MTIRESDELIGSMKKGRVSFPANLLLRMTSNIPMNAASLNDEAEAVRPLYSSKECLKRMGCRSAKRVDGSIDIPHMSFRVHLFAFQKTIYSTPTKLTKASKSVTYIISSQWRQP